MNVEVEFNCIKIMSSFKNDQLEFPKKGKVILDQRTNQLTLRVKKDKLFFNQQLNDEYQTSSHQVKKIYSSFFSLINK